MLRGGFGVFYSPMLTGTALGLANNNQASFNVNIFDFFFIPKFSCTPPYFLTYPVPNPLPTCTPGLPTNQTGLDKNVRDTYSLHWSLGVQHEIAKDTILEASYVANRGVKGPAGAAYAGEELNLSPFSSTNQLSQNFGQIRRFGNFVNSNYESLQVSLRRRVSKGVTLDANYTYAHETDDAVNILTGAYQNSHNPNLDYASGDIDVRHNFTLGAVWDLPVATSLPKRLAEGWQISSLLQARGGLPYNIAVAPPFLGIDQIRPNLTGQPLSFAGSNTRALRVTRRSTRQLSLLRPRANTVIWAAIPAAVPASPSGTLPSQRPQRLTNGSPSNSAANFSTFSTIPPNFANPDGNLTDSTFGISTSTIANHVGTGTSRQAQLVLKLLF